MAILDIKLTSPGIIDNATIYLEDPSERIPIFFNPINDGEWECKNVRVPIQGSLELSLYVLGYSGTKFECEITRMSDSKTINVKGRTGNYSTNVGRVIASKNFT